MNVHGRYGEEDYIQPMFEESYDSDEDYAENRFKGTCENCNKIINKREDCKRIPVYASWTGWFCSWDCGMSHIMEKFDEKERTLSEYLIESFKKEEDLMLKIHASKCIGILGCSENNNSDTTL